MAISIRETVDNLPETGVTVYALRGLDFVVPGVWENNTDFEQMVTQATGHGRPDQVQQIAGQAEAIFADESTGYQRALWIYQNIDTADAALGAAAMANKVGERVGFLSFLSRLTPKADTTQSIDLGLKLAGELIAFCTVNGLPRDSAGMRRFATALADEYSGPSLMRMVALVCIDGVLPLGPDFTRKASNILGGLSPAQLEENSMYQRVSGLIPGDSTAGQLSFINDNLGTVRGWIDNLINTHNLTPERISGQLAQYIEIADDKLDYVAAFLDMSTNYFSHTGSQSLAQSVIRKTAG